MNVIDISGPIKDGMWNYEDPFPKFGLHPLGEVPWVGCEVYCEIFNGLHSQTGTYLETPAHFYGNSNCYLVSDIPIGKLVNIPCTILMLEETSFDRAEKRLPITSEMLEACAEGKQIETGSAILVGTGWGKYWMDAGYLTHSPYFTKDAVRWLLSRKPYLLGSDFPRWENMDKPEGFFPEFYAADVLMLAPCVNLESAGNRNCRLTVLPLNIPGTSCVPCRAIIQTEQD